MSKKKESELGHFTKETQGGASKLLRGGRIGLSNTFPASLENGDENMQNVRPTLDPVFVEFLLQVMNTLNTH